MNECIAKKVSFVTQTCANIYISINACSSNVFLHQHNRTHTITCYNLPMAKSACIHEKKDNKNETMSLRCSTIKQYHNKIEIHAKVTIAITFRRMKLKTIQWLMRHECMH